MTFKDNAMVRHHMGFNQSCPINHVIHVNDTVPTTSIYMVAKNHTMSYLYGLFQQESPIDGGYFAEIFLRFQASDGYSPPSSSWARASVCARVCVYVCVCMCEM